MMLETEWREEITFAPWRPADARPKDWDGKGILWVYNAKENRQGFFQNEEHLDWEKWTHWCAVALLPALGEG
jgi:hypothetical protein